MNRHISPWPLRTVLAGLAGAACLALAPSPADAQQAGLTREIFAGRCAAEGGRFFVLGGRLRCPLALDATIECTEDRDALSCRSIGLVPEAVMTRLLAPEAGPAQVAEATAAAPEVLPTFTTEAGEAIPFPKADPRRGD